MGDADLGDDLGAGELRLRRSQIANGAAGRADPCGARVRLDGPRHSDARRDIDLLVIGEVGFAELVQVLYPLQQALQREINPVLYTAAEFYRRARGGEAFVRQFLDQPNVFLTGDKDDLAELAGNQTLVGPHA